MASEVITTRGQGHLGRSLRCFDYCPTPPPGGVPVSLGHLFLGTHSRPTLAQQAGSSPLNVALLHLGHLRFSDVTNDTHSSFLQPKPHLANFSGKILLA